MRNKVIAKRLAKIMMVVLFLMITPSSLAQFDRFQKFGVKLDQATEFKIQFWKKIFSEYSSHDYVIHDSDDLSKIYAIASSEQGAQKEKNKVQKENPKAQARVQRGQKDHLSRADDAATPYLNRMEELLEEAGVPKELASLPFVESAFNHEAKSKVGATGIWQFMPKTAARDLRITDAIDERLDPLKSTRAAARFLKRNYDQFQSWALAIMAYHQGPGLVEKAIKKLKSRDPLFLIREFRDPQFQFASKNYLFEFLAMVDVRSTPVGQLPSFITISFPKKMKMKEILVRFHVQEQATRILNPHFRSPIWSNRLPIPAHYPIRLSGITLEEFRKLQYSKDQ